MAQVGPSLRVTYWLNFVHTDYVISVCMLVSALGFCLLFLGDVVLVTFTLAGIPFGVVILHDFYASP